MTEDDLAARADAAFLEYLHRKEREPDLTLEGFCQGDGRLTPLLRKMQSVWELLGSDGESSGVTDVGGETTSYEPPRPLPLPELLDELRRPRDPAAYHVLNSVARGGMSEILRVWDARLRRIVAMKLLPEKAWPTARGSSGSRPVARMLEEAQVTAQLQHPSILSVHDLGIDSRGHIFFTMPLVKGRHLGEVIDLVHEGKEGWTLVRALTVMERVCEAMAYAHSKGVIHRDLKPSNVMVGRFGETFVLDWGLARVLRPEPVTADSSFSSQEVSLDIESLRRRMANDTPTSSILTMDGAVVGTPAYMPPEQARGHIEEIGIRSDVYSTGAILYQLLSGRRPYASRGTTPTAEELLERVRIGPPEPLERIARDVPAELVSICEKAMSREPGNRYPDLLEMAADLRAYQEGRVVSAHRTGALAEARKWVVRNRIPALAAAATALAVVAGLLVIAGVERRSKQELQEREVALSKANRGLEAARARAQEQVEELRGLVYSNSVARAAQALEQDDYGLMMRILDGCDPNLRRWEWRHLRARAEPWLRRFASPDAKCIRDIIPLPGGRFASCGYDTDIRIWDVATGDLVRVLKGHAAYIDQMDLSPDRRLLVSASRDRTARIWDVATGETLQILEGHTAELKDVLFLGDGARLVTSASDLSLRVWDVASGEPMQTLRGHTSAPVRLALSHDGSRLASGDTNGKVLLWDTASLETKGELDLGSKPGFLQFLEDGTLLASVTTTGYRGRHGLAPSEHVSFVQVRSTETGEKIREFPLPKNFAVAAISPGRGLVATDDGTSARLLDLGSGEEKGRLPGHSSRVVAFSWLDDERLLVGDYSGAVSLWHQGVRPGERTLELEGPCLSLAFSPASSLLALGLDGATVALCGLEGEVLPLSLESSGNVVTLAFSSDGRTLAAWARDGMVSLWDLPAGKLQRRFRIMHTNGTMLLAISPRDRTLIVVSDGGITIWPIEGAGATSLSNLLGARGCSFTPDGDRLAACYGGSLVLWDWLTREPLRQLASPSRATFGRAAFSPDGRRLLVTGFFDAGHSILDGETFEVLVDLESRQDEKNAVLDSGWLDGGRRVATTGRAGTIDLFEATTGRFLLSLTGGDPDRVIPFVVSPDGRTLAAPGPGNTVKIWEVPSDTAMDSAGISAAPGAKKHSGQ